MTKKKSPDLSNASDEDLRAEIELRAKRIGTPPDPLPNPDFAPLQSMIVACLAEAIVNHYWPKDFKQYVYESAMQAVYGEKLWPWLNSINWQGD